MAWEAFIGTPCLVGGGGGGGVLYGKMVGAVVESFRVGNSYFWYLSGVVFFPQV